MDDYKIMEELKKDGFSDCEIAEIFAYLGCGHGIDSAMSIVLDKRQPAHTLYELTVYKDGYEIDAYAEFLGKDLAGNSVVEYGLVDMRTEDVWHVERADAWEWDHALSTLSRLVDIYMETGDFG